jgi:hypothetical protein
MKKYMAVRNGSGMELNLPQLDPGYQWKVTAPENEWDSWEMSIINSRQETVYSEQLEALGDNEPLVEDIEKVAEKLGQRFAFWFIDQNSDEKDVDLTHYQSVAGTYA